MLDQIPTLYAQGMSQADIARTLGVTRGCVSKRITKDPEADLIKSLKEQIRELERQLQFKHNPRSTGLPRLTITMINGKPVFHSINIERKDIKPIVESCLEWRDKKRFELVF